MCEWIKQNVIAVVEPKRNMTVNNKSVLSSALKTENKYAAGAVTTHNKHILKINDIYYTIYTVFHKNRTTYFRL